MNHQVILHTVNKSPFQHNALSLCLSYFKQPHDAMVLLEDGAYSILAKQPVELPKTSVYAIREDVEARGLLNQPTISRVQLIDYETFVALSARFPLIQSWY